MNDPGQFRIESTGHSERSSSESRVDEMDSEIEFGEVEQLQPATGLRPDKDKHFAVTECGVVNDSDLPIFVDMDVMRDMEAHARENTRVELGGVMLGRQHLDEEGNPFVIITDSLRAKHYEATKGSFKFTHETWSQITRERNEFKSDLELVGWYHTHPGWGVFLSGMDLFICNNFFSRPLDVALVIDPCAGDRGWFQWGNTGETRQTPGFFLMTNRHRRAELNYFTGIFRDPNANTHDPRFSQASFSTNQLQQEEDMVNVIDNRRPFFEFAIVSMLFLQMLLVGFFGYRLLGEFGGGTADEVEARIALLEGQYKSDTELRNSTIREKAYQGILNQIVAGETGADGLVEQFADLKQQSVMLSESLEGQLARVERSRNVNAELSYNLSNEKEKSKRLEDELRQAQDSIQKVQQINKDLSAKVGLEEGEPTSAIIPPWLLYTIGGIGFLAIGLVGGTWYARSQNQEFEASDDRMLTIEKSGEVPAQSDA